MRFSTSHKYPKLPPARFMRGEGVAMVREGRVAPVRCHPVSGRQSGYLALLEQIFKAPYDPQMDEVEHQRNRSYYQKRPGGYANRWAGRELVRGGEPGQDVVPRGSVDASVLAEAEASCDGEEC